MYLVCTPLQDWCLHGLFSVPRGKVHVQCRGKEKDIDLLRKLQEAHLSSHVPGLPHGVVVGGGQAGVGNRGAGRGPHDALCQQKVTEQAGHQQILQIPTHHMISLYQDLLGLLSASVYRRSHPDN